MPELEREYLAPPVLNNLSAAQLYHYYQGLGAILEPVAAFAGLLLRPTGLYWQPALGATYLVSRDSAVILRILRYDVARFETGFADELALFEFVASSPFYIPRSFFPKARDLVALRAARRFRLYRQFEAWLKPQHRVWEHWRPISAGVTDELAPRSHLVPMALLWAGPDFLARYQGQVTEELGG